jgi:hypothetical protein
MMCIREMRVGVAQRFMVVSMAVFHSRRNQFAVFVVVVFIVRMLVVMIHIFVVVLVSMPLGQVQPNAQGHESPGDQQTPADRFAE